MTHIDRGAGVLAHISTLPGQYSCGSFGKEAFAFVDLLADGGFSYWQVLPFCIPDEFASPYKSFSAFAGNLCFIDLPTLAEEGLLTPAELNGARQNTPYLAEWARLFAERELLLRKAAARARNRAEIEAYVAENPPIADACRFLALKRANGGLPWWEWRENEPDADDLYFYAFTQYHFHRQWQAVKAYANQKGVRIIGDIPIYVAEDSADVWANRAQFLLKENGRPTAVAGVPPDYFSTDGQLWGNPLYNWEMMKNDGFAWWRARLSHAFSLFDGVRFDHFRGIESFWSVPASAATAREGHWEKGPGMAFIRAVKEVAGKRLVIAEDLGDITPAVAKLVKDSGFPGIRVFQFAFLGDSKTPHLPHNYTANCVAYTGTHDNNTLLGYVWEQNEGERRQMLDYCHYDNPDWNRCYEAILRTMLESHAGLVIFPIQDLLGYGADTRMNRPGTASGNWAFRVTPEALGGIDRGKWKHLCELYGRM